MEIGIGVIGTGIMGGDHARTLAHAIKGATLVAVADPDEKRAQTVAVATSAQHTQLDPFHLIDDPSVEAVVITSPDATHESLVLACLSAGKPVLCEKPLAADSEGCIRIVEAEMALGRRLVQVGFMQGDGPSRSLNPDPGRRHAQCGRYLARCLCLWPDEWLGCSAIRADGQYCRCHEVRTIRWPRGRHRFAGASRAKPQAFG